MSKPNFDCFYLDLAGFAKLVPRTGTGGGPGAVFLLPALADAAAGCFAAETAFAETDDFVVEADPGSAYRYAPGESFFLEEAGGTGRVELLLLFCFSHLLVDFDFVPVGEVGFF